jgi:hypothetical protein
MTEERAESKPARSEPAESEPARSEPTESGSADTSRAEPHSEENRCSECGERTIPGSDKCQHCGKPLESGRAISLEMWEWGGMLIAAFGFFLTPVLPGPIALYFAYRVYEYKPSAARDILLIIVGTVVFWIFLPLVVLPG